VYEDVLYNDENYDHELEEDVEDVICDEWMAEMKRMHDDMNFGASKVRELFPSVFWDGRFAPELVLKLKEKLADKHKVNWIYNSLLLNPGLIARTINGN
jgi:hypothetical protein